MKTPQFQFPNDRATYILPAPDMLDFSILRALAVPSARTGLHYVAIINDSARLWRFVRGPVTVHSSRVWHWLARVDPRWLNAGWCISDELSNAASPDAVLDGYAKYRTERTP
jgi:hypothetical protein